MKRPVWAELRCPHGTTGICATCTRAIHDTAAALSAAALVERRWRR